MSGSVLFNHIGTTSGVHRGTKLTPVTSRATRWKSEKPLNRGTKPSRMGHAFLLHMLISGSSSSSRTSPVPHAVVLEDEQSPSPVLNGVADDWSVPGSRDWDGQETTDPTGRFPAIAGLLAVAGAGYFCTQMVGTLMNRRTELARIVPHPVAFSTASSTTTTTPRASMEGDEIPHLRSRPLSPGSYSRSETPIIHDQSTSPIPGSPQVHRSTSMSGLEVQEEEIEDDFVSLTSAASSVAVSEVDSLDSSFDGQLPDVSQFRSITPAMLEKLPYEYTIDSLRERGQLAMRAASTATEAAQKASEISAAASMAASVAAKASRQAMTAASLAHNALESGDLKKMNTAQIEAWNAAQLAAEAERRAASAAVLATAYEDHATQQAKVARELSILPATGFRAISRSIKEFLNPVISPIIEITTGMYRWIAGAWMYFASGTFFCQVWSLTMGCVSFIQGLCVALYVAIRSAVLYVINSITSVCGKTYSGAKNGVSSSFAFLKSFFSKLLNLRGSIGGSATA